MDKDTTIGGRWNVLGKEYQGDLTFNETNGMIILSIYYKNMHEYLPLMGKPIEIETITGKLNQEIKCTLVDCRVVKKHSYAFVRHHIIIVAKSMILNLHKKSKESLKFNEIHLHVANIVKWSTLSGFECINNNNYRLNIGYKFKNKIVQKINDNTVVEFTPCLGGFNYDTQIEKLDISQHVEVRIIKKKEACLFEFLEDFKMISDMITLATETKINVSKVFGINYKRYKGSVGTKKNYVKNQIITNLVNYSADSNTDASSVNYFLFNLNDISSKGKLKKWFKTYPDFSNVYNLYNLGINNNVPNEIRFCNLIQGLELIHSKKFKKVKKFFKHIDEKFGDGSVIANLIKNNKDQEDDYIILKNRLIDIFINNFELASCEEIVDNIDAITTIFSDTRNYYTHYGDSKKDKCLVGENLKYGICVLEYLLSCFILLNLGFDIGYINQNQKWRYDYIMDKNMIERVLKNDRLS